MTEELVKPETFHFLSKRFGPFTIWQWTAVGSVGVLVVSLLHKNSSAVVTTPTVDPSVGSQIPTSSSDLTSIMSDIDGQFALLTAAISHQTTPVQTPVTPVTDPTAPSASHDLSSLIAAVTAARNLPRFQTPLAQGALNTAQQFLPAMQAGTAPYNDAYVRATANWLQTYQPSNSVTDMESTGATPAAAAPQSQPVPSIPYVTTPYNTSPTNPNQHPVYDANGRLIMWTS